MSKLSEYLGIPKAYVEDFDASYIQLMEDEGSSGDVVYSYYFDVPDDMPEELLEIMGWSVDQCIDDIPAWVVDGDFDEALEDDVDDDEEDYDEDDDDYY